MAIAYPAPKADLAQFTKQTGIKVNWDYVQWDSLQTKIAAAAQAHSYFADVADVDWSKVGEYYATKWFMPLNKYFPPSGVRSQFPQAPAFIRNGQLLGMPMDGSLLVTTMNEKYLKAAGVKKNPTTLAQYETDLKAIASKTSAKNPLDIPFAAAEGLSTYWYEMTAAFGGNVLSANYKPLFTSPSSPGYKAMTWMINAYKTGLVPKANLNYQDYQALAADQAHGLTASVFSDYSGDVGTIYNVASESKVVGDVNYIPTPGASGVGSNLGNPDGIGIPAEAKHVGSRGGVHEVDGAAGQPGRVRRCQGSQVRDPDLPAAVEPRRPGGSGQVGQGARRRDPAVAAREPREADLPGRRAAVVLAVQQRGVHQHPPSCRRQRVGGRGDQRDRVAGEEPRTGKSRLVLGLPRLGGPSPASSRDEAHHNR